MRRLLSGQQTYGHPHQMAGGWMPSHVLAMDQSGAIAQSHSHNMYEMAHPSLAPMYYDMDSSLAVAHTVPDHGQHVPEHHSAILSQVGQPTSQQSQVLPSTQTAQGGNHQAQNIAGIISYNILTCGLPLPQQLEGNADHLD